MENFWTSKKPIIGLRHFVLVNKTKEEGENFFLMVSVVDCEINLKITHKELLNSGNWEKGLLNLPKTESITEDYVRFKSLNKKKGINKVFLNDDSLFNIS
ncbi:MAG: TIGR02450 family Trp-rich protein [Prochlorococcus marinus CUG1439]|uniref:TIGR02450 family Trp-rich protein n=1 Tax=Prochlorococcus sp. MIT 1314 TaxID=3096220 RepID=UPI001B207E0A|nr:TIGR02450 family Trp-rich protein [Prochlorococcus sp. MIT 1314]MCR8539950.1 TIGR02450 family Trp-rich protein [Prochlorococcus marinus CUG1439]